MPATLPVPSKGALRTLRHLALGTTCTLALSAGLLTEDRRRRIHAARIIRENTRKLKGVKNYQPLAVDLQDVANDPAIFTTGDSMMKKLTKETNRSLADESLGELDSWPGTEEEPTQVFEGVRDNTVDFVGRQDDLLSNDSTQNGSSSLPEETSIQDRQNVPPNGAGEALKQGVRNQAESVQDEPTPRREWDRHSNAQLMHIHRQNLKHNISSTQDRLAISENLHIRRTPGKVSSSMPDRFAISENLHIRRTPGKVSSSMPDRFAISENLHIRRSPIDKVSSSVLDRSVIPENIVKVEASPKPQLQAKSIQDKPTPRRKWDRHSNTQMMKILGIRKYHVSSMPDRSAIPETLNIRRIVGKVSSSVLDRPTIPEDLVNIKTSPEAQLLVNSIQDEPAWTILDRQSQTQLMQKHEKRNYHVSSIPDQATTLEDLINVETSPEAQLPAKSIQDEPTWRTLDIGSKVEVLPEMQALQKKLASDVIKLLACVENPADLDATVLSFLGAFGEGNLVTPDSGLVPELLDAACQLSKACKGRENLEDLIRILDTLLPYSGPMDAAQFLLFSPYTVIKHSLEKLRGQDQTDTEAIKINLNKLSSMYIKVCNKDDPPAGLDMDLAVTLGERLCEETNRHGLHDLTVDVYPCLKHYCFRAGRKPTAKSMGHHIDSNCRLGRHLVALEYFRRFYQKGLPTADEFNMVINGVIDSTIKLHRLYRAEEVLNTAIKMGKASGLSVSTTPVLRVISHSWWSSRDFQSSRELFDRLLLIAHSFRRPQAVYQAIIHVCIASDHVDAATSYYTQLRKFYEPTLEDFNIYGQFAIAKARRGDWTSVEEDLIQIASSNPKPDKFAALFAPILKLFGASHSVYDTEKFIMTFIDRASLTPTPIISNIMIGIYCKAKETNALCRWMEFTASVQSIDTVTTNIILHHCYSTLGFSYEETQAFYRKICACATAAGNFTGKENLDYLAELAAADSPSPKIYRSRMLPLSIFGRLKHTQDTLGVHRAISATHKKDEPLATIEIYRKARADNIALSPKTFAMTALACMKTQGHEKAMAMIKEAQDRGDDISYAISNCLTWHVMNSRYHQTPIELLDLVKSTISSLEKSKTRIDQGILAGAMTMLVRRGEFRLAINFWHDMSSRLEIPPSSIAIPTLIALMHAYIESRDSYGVIWIQSLLEKTRIAPTRQFLTTLTRKINDMKLQNAHGARKSIPLLRHMDRLRVRVVLLRRKYLAEKELFKSSVLGVVEGITGVKYIRRRRRNNRPGPWERRRKYRAKLRAMRLAGGAIESTSEASQELPVPSWPRQIKPLPRNLPLLERKSHRPSANHRYLKITPHASYKRFEHRNLKDDLGSVSSSVSQDEDGGAM